MKCFDQSEFDVRCEWGLPAIEYLFPSEIVVIVDVLSFTTSVEIATSRGARIFPYQWKDDTALAYAKERDAEVASTRNRFEGKFSLAPSSLVEVPSSLRLVLPSPNGSTIAFRAMSEGSTVWKDEWLADNLGQMPASKNKFWLSVGDKEIESGVSHPPTGMRQDVTQVAACERLATALMAKGHAVHYDLYHGGHETKPWKDELPRALSWLLGKTSVS